MSNTKNISTFINAYRKQQEIEAFEKEVSEAGGIEISKARQLVIDSNLDQKQSAEMYKMIDSWKGNGFVIDDIPMEFNTYQAGAREQGKYAIRKSVFENIRLTILKGLILMKSILTELIFAEFIF